MAVSLIFDPPAIRESPFLLALLNLLFLGLIPLVMTVLATKSYLVTGARTFLCMGCGLLSFGVSSIMAGCAMHLPIDHPNATVTLHNIGILWAGGCHLASALFLFTDLFTGNCPKSSRRTVGVVYGATLLALAGIAAAVSVQLLAPFFVQGAGPGTSLRIGGITA